MNSNNLNPQADELVEVQCADHWQVYYRLIELDISCWCSYYQPLKVQVSSVTTAIQIWSVAQQVTLPRQTLINWLETCWRICSSPKQEN